MNPKILVLGSKTTARWVAASLSLQDDDVDCFPNLPDTPLTLKSAKYELVVIDSYLTDLEDLCFKLVWLYRLRIVIVTYEIEKDWSEFKLSGADAVLSLKINNAELAAALKAIILKGPLIFPGLKALVVEDDPSIRETISLCFGLYWPEIELTLANDGKSGVAMTKTETPDIVVLDLGLPDITGFEVMAQIRSFSQVPILILTATNNKEYIVKAIQEGASSYIVKPFKQISLMTRVKNRLSPF